MSKHPLILSAEIRLEQARRREIDAKNEAEAAMRLWASRSADVGSAESAVHYLRRYIETPNISN